MILSPAELAQLTGRTRKDAQVRALRFMGFEHKLRPDGTIVVLRAHVEAQLGGNVPESKRASVEPEWDAMYRK